MESIEQKIVARVGEIDNDMFAKYSKDITTSVVIEVIAKAIQRGEKECILKDLGNFPEINKKLCLRLVEYTNFLLYGHNYEGNRKYIVKWHITNTTLPPKWQIIVIW